MEAHPGLPGFTGEAALEKVGSSFMTGPLRHVTDPHKPSLQLVEVARRRGDDWCIPGCICVSPIGCPCCDVAVPRAADLAAVGRRRFSGLRLRASRG
jgi:hypothetical protein